MRRGRPPHADILTPRQWQVLELLQDGLTNEQIGERLGLTADGAKYHVAEILGKLGVSSRAEAVDWYRRGARKPAWSPVALLQPLAGRWLPAAVLVGALVLLGLFAVAVLSSHSDQAGDRTAFVSLVAGSAEDFDPNGGYRDGPAAQALFSQPASVAIDRDGNVYVADFGNNRLRKIAPDGSVTTVEGPGEVGLANGAPTPPELTGLFFSPQALATDGEGNVYLAGLNEWVIYKVTPDGETTAIAGDPRPQVPDLSPLEGPWAPYRDLPLLGAAGDVLVMGTTGLAAGEDGSVYLVGDQIDILAGRNQMVRRVTPEGEVVLVAGSEEAGYRDGTGSEARFDRPHDIAIDRRGNLYVADSGNRRVRKIDPDGVVTTVAGSGEAGLRDGPALEARFTSLDSITVAADGSIYVGDGSTIRMITTSGEVVTLAGAGSGVSHVEAGLRDGPGNAALFQESLDLAAAPSGDLYVADRFNHLVRRISFRDTDPADALPTPPTYRALLLQNETLMVMAYDDYVKPAETPFCIDIIESLASLRGAALGVKPVPCATGGPTQAINLERYVFIQGTQGLYLQGVRLAFYATAPADQIVPVRRDYPTQDDPYCTDVTADLAPGDQPLQNDYSLKACIVELPLPGETSDGFIAWSYVPDIRPAPAQTTPPTGLPTPQPTPALPQLTDPAELPAETPCYRLSDYFGRGGGEGPIARVRCQLPSR